MRILEAICVFVVGAVLYVSIEVIYRGFSHFSMAIAGGFCFLVLHLLFSRYELNLFTKCVISMLVITAVEFIVGYIVNIRLGMNVWDYSHRKWNVYGQICPLFSGIWFAMGVPISILSKVAERAFILLRT